MAQAVQLEPVALAEGVEEEIEAIVQPLRDRRDSLEAELLELARRTAERRESIRRIDSILKQVSAPKPGPKKAQAKAKTEKKYGPGDIERGKQVAELMRSKPDKPDWERREVMEALNMEGSAATRAMNWARDEGLIGATRKIRGGGNAYAAFPE